MREPLQKWFNEQRDATPNDMIWKKASERQIIFARDKIGGLVGCGLEYEDRKERFAWVISEHTSKSIRLPVYSFERSDIGFRLVARENFFNWKFSFISERPIEADFGGLFHTTPPLDPKYTGDPLSHVYFEGFPRDLIFRYYAESDKRRWSAEVCGDEAAWTTVFLVMRALGVIKPLVWSVQP